MNRIGVLFLFGFSLFFTACDTAVDGDIEYKGIQSSSFSVRPIASSVSSSSQSSLAVLDLIPQQTGASSSIASPIVSNDSGLKAIGVMAPSVVGFSNEEPMKNEEMNITISDDGVTNISVTVHGDGCGSIQSASGSSPLVMTGHVGESGSCNVSAQIMYANSDAMTYENRFDVASTDALSIPILVKSAILVAGSLPQPTITPKENSELPVILDVKGPKEFINGGSLQLDAHIKEGINVAGLMVKFDNYSGYYIIPGGVQNDDGNVTVPFALQFALDYFDLNGLQNVNVSVLLYDSQNQISEPYRFSMHGTETGYGDIKVSISWDTMTDVDLHVTDPKGNVTFYSNLKPGNGSELDLDSNPDCDIDGVNNENIFWQTGLSEPGTYGVKVHMYADCGIGQASGTLTMTYAGGGSPRTESWELGATGSERLFSFEHGSSSGYSVSGQALFEDFSVAANGKSVRRMKPVRFAKVEVVRLVDELVMATGATDTNGRYALSFSNDNPARSQYYVRVYAMQNDDTLKQSVQDYEGNVYAFHSNSIANVITTPQNDGMDIMIKKEDGAGALNIYDVGVEANNFMRLYAGKATQMVTFKWKQGIETAFGYADRTISVNGSLADPDEYDDLVIAHGYGHFVMEAYSLGNTAGETHQVTSQIAPNLAWAEGWATFFASAVMNKSYYIDLNGNGIGNYMSIETLSTTIALGNANNTLDGQLSEAVVAAVLWDLYDATNESSDTLGNNALAIWKILTDYLATDKFKDRGANGVDLVDFLDGWFCLGFGDKGSSTEGVEGIVKGIHQLSYDFAEVGTCK